MVGVTAEGIAGTAKFSGVIFQRFDTAMTSVRINSEVAKSQEFSNRVDPVHDPTARVWVWCYACRQVVRHKRIDDRLLCHEGVVLGIVWKPDGFIGIAHRLGLPLKDLIGTGIRKTTGKVAVQYRNPANATEEWTGRGRQPKWVKELIASGKDLQTAKVKA